MLQASNETHSTSLLAAQTKSLRLRKLAGKSHARFSHARIRRSFLINTRRGMGYQAVERNAQ